MAPSIFHRSPASATEKPDVVTSFSVEDDLDKVWAEVIARCNKITSWDLNENNASIDEVLGKLNPPKERSVAKETAKAVFKDALVCVQTFGQIAANAAGAVFGPSQQCFNAINFVITAVQNYDAVFDNITVLMERLSVFMNKLRIHLEAKGTDEKLDKRLRYTVYRVLDHFLTILGISHKLTKGWKSKLKLAVDIGAFGKDEGIKDAMAKLETRIVDVMGSEISVIVQDLSEAARNIRGVDRKLDLLVETQEKVMSVMGNVETQQEQTNITLVRVEAGQDKTNTALDKQNTSLAHLETAEKRRQADEDELKRLGDIAEALNLPKAEKPWKERQDDLVTRCIAGTGEWLLNHGTFSRWANSGDENDETEGMPTMKLWTNVLSLRAGEGYGKTHLCSLVVKHLLEKYCDDHRTGVAFHYIKRTDQDRKGDSQSPGDVSPSDGNAINKALKSIMYQLAAAKTSLGRDFAKMIHRTCSSKAGGFGKSADLWNSLVTESAKSLEGTFFIVLDGIDETDGEPGRPLAQIIKEIITPIESSQLKIRLFFTGRPEGLDSLSLDPEDSVPTITIPPEGDLYPNETDLMLFAEDHLKNLDLFRDGNNTPLKERTKSELVKAVHGDVVSLNLKLSKVKLCRSIRDVEKELKFAGESKEQGIRREMIALELTLDQEEIQELNHLLSWEAVCDGNRHVDVYKQYLLLQPSETQSLVPLNKQITERYSTIFNLDDSGIVTLKTDGIRDYLKDEDSDAREEAEETTLQEGEVNLVKSLLKTHFGRVFGSDDTYTKFGFEGFFENKLKPRPAHIHIGSTQDCELRSSKACLAAICDHFDDEQFTALQNYSWEFFIYHLMQINADDVDVPTMQEIGRRLVRIIYDVDHIDKWWDGDRLYDLREEWVYSTRTTDTLFDLLKNPAAQSGLSNMPAERQWVIKTTSEEGPSIRILMHIAKRMAERWFTQVEGVWFNSMNWLHGYLSHLRGEQPEFVIVKYEDMCKIEEWAKETLKNGDEEGKWHACMGRTCQIANHWEETIDRYRQAVELLPEDYELKLDLAWSFGMHHDPKLAVETWEGVVNSQHERMASDKEFKEERLDKILTNMFQLIGDCRISLKEFEKTKDTYNKLLDEDWQLRLRLARALERNEELKEARDTLQDLVSGNTELLTSNEEYKTEYWETILHFIGECNVKIEEFEEAESTYRRLVTEGMQRDTFESFAKKAVFAMTDALFKQEKHKEAISALEELELRSDPEVGTWLVVLLHEYAADDDFNERISLAALRSGHLETLVEKYRMAIRSARGQRLKTGVVLQLQYFLAALHWSHEESDARHMALGLWEDILYQSLPEGIEEEGGQVWGWIWWARVYSADKLATSLLHLAKGAGLSQPLNPEAEKYAARLRKLTQADARFVRDRTKNTQISLTRLYHLSGNDEEARETVREHLRVNFEKTTSEDASTREDGWRGVAYVLQAMDDDENALAAWLQMAPFKPTAETSEDAVDEDGEDSTHIEEGNDETPEDGEVRAEDGNDGKEDDKAEVAANGLPTEAETEDRPEDVTAESATESETAVTNGEKDASENTDLPEAMENHDDSTDATEVLTNGVSEPNGINGTRDDEEDAGEESKEGVLEDSKEDADAAADEPAAEEKLTGPGGSRCDGGCGKGWTYIGEVGKIYACKECLDVQFEAGCWDKLQAGTLNIRVCHAKHEFLQLPDFDRQRWENTDADQMWVGEELVPRAEWVDRIKKQWKIDEASIKARERFLWSVRRIQRAWRLSRWIRKGNAGAASDLILRCFI